MKMSEVETQEPEIEENPLAGLVQAALDKDYNKANELFGQAITVKLDDIIDQEKIKVSDQLFNGAEEEQEEEPDEDTDDSEDDSEVEDAEAEDDVDADEENSSE